MNAIPTASGASAAAPLLLKRKARSRRPLIAVAALAAVGLVAWQVAGRLGGGEAPPAFATAPAAKADVISQVTATGTLSPVVTVEVGSQVSGRIAELHADYNSEVKKGDVIARLDPELFVSALTQAKARLASARADLARARAQAENARAHHERVAALAATGAIAAAEVDSALAARRSAEATSSAAISAITLAKAAVEQAETNLQYTTIKSPIDGVVIARSVDVGQTVAASLSAPVLFIIAEDLRKMEVHTAVAESDIGRLQPGLAVEFSVDAYPDRRFEGTVKQVRYEAASESNVVTYDAVVALDNPDLALRPGMTANVSFIVEARRDVLTVASKALTYRPANSEAMNEMRERRRAARGQGGEAGERPRRRPGASAGERGGRGNRRMVFVLENGAPKPVRVTVGLSDGATTEITGGELAEGALVITGDDSAAPAAREAPPQGRQGRRGGRRGPRSIL
jgi:HlyD family secretion protein